MIKKIWNGSQLAIDRYKCFQCDTILIGLIWTWDILSKLHTSMCDLCKKTHLLSNLSHISKIPCLFLKAKCVILAMIRFLLLLFYRITTWRHRWLRDSVLCGLTVSHDCIIELLSFIHSKRKLTLIVQYSPYLLFHLNDWGFV